MKKMICFLLTALLATGLLAGCEQTDGRDSFTAENEIFTYTKVDPEKTQLVVSRTGNLDINNFCTKFESENPDIQIIYVDITGGNKDYLPVVDWIKNGILPDVMITAVGFMDDEVTMQYFENLSADPILENYEAAALKHTDTNANVYWLPGPSDINAIMYNKTMFDQYGWKVPESFDEFIDLCLQIRKDTNGEVEPWNPNAKYSDELLVAMEAITYEELFGGAQNRAWYNDFIEGNATFAGHMEPYYEVYQKLIDNDILREEHFTYSATTRHQEFSEGKIAMINMVITDSGDESCEVGYMPFPSTEGGLGYICSKYSCFVGIPKKEHREAERDAINRFIEFFSTVEGQQAFIGDSIKVSNIKNATMNRVESLSHIQAAAKAGHMFEKIDFSSDLGTFNVKLHQDALDMVTGAKTGATCIANADLEPYCSEEETSDGLSEIIGTIPENMTVLETSFYIADTYREKAGADIGLIGNNVAFRGNLMRLFAGDITAPIVTVLKPRSFENDATLVKVTMTGRQLMEALNAPLDYNDSVADCIYAYSGLKCKVAPWNATGEKYLSVTLEDGTEIDTERLYTVAVWEGTINEEYITGTEEAYEETFEDIMTEKIRADGAVVAANDDRIELVWE